MTTHTKTEQDRELRRTQSRLRDAGQRNGEMHGAIETLQGEVDHLTAECDKLREQVKELLSACKQVDVAYETLSDGALNGAIDKMRAAIAKVSKANEAS
jgi:prefoldin subunit 5